MNIKDIEVGKIYYTDYPIIEFGDKPDELAPIRACLILENNEDKYVIVDVYQEYTDIPCKYEIKSGYIYKTRN